MRQALFRQFQKISLESTGRVLGLPPYPQSKEEKTLCIVYIMYIYLPTHNFY